MEGKENKRSEIVNIAARLFVEQGYGNTGMRQIAEEAGVSLSLANYHFGSKKNLCILLLQGHLKALYEYVNKYTTQNDTRLYLATILRLSYRIFTSAHLRGFYEDILKNDIYLEALTNAHAPFEKQNELPLDEKYELLYDSYIPVSMERAMAICPFTVMLDIDVPELIFKYFMYEFIGGEPLHDKDWYVTRSRSIVQQILMENPHLYDIFHNLHEWV